jgi:hypothetical protein
METNDNSANNGTFLKFLLVFTGFVTALVGISWLVMSFIK